MNLRRSPSSPVAQASWMASTSRSSPSAPSAPSLPASVPSPSPSVPSPRVSAIGGAVCAAGGAESPRRPCRRMREGRGRGGRRRDVDMGAPVWHAGGRRSLRRQPYRSPSPPRLHRWWSAWAAKRFLGGTGPQGHPRPDRRGDGWRVGGAGAPCGPGRRRPPDRHHGGGILRRHRRLRAAGVRRAVARIDACGPIGVHPRVGAAGISRFPLVPLRGVSWRPASGWRGAWGRAGAGPRGAGLPVGRPRPAPGGPPWRGCVGASGRHCREAQAAPAGPRGPGLLPRPSPGPARRW